MQKLVCALLCLAPLAVAQDRDSGYLGVHVAPLTAETRASFRVPEGIKSGVLLTQVEKGSAAAKAGLRAGDVLTRLGKAEITSVEDLVRRVGKHRAGERVAYRVRRGNGTIEGLLLLGRRPAAAKTEKRSQTTIRVAREPRKETIDKRLDRVSKQIEELRRRAKAKAKTTRGGGMANWVRREEQALATARKNGNERGVAYHTARLKLLQEMRRAGMAGGPRRQASRGGRSNLGARVSRIEKKLDRILKLLAEEADDD